jgi:hypothetical protein
MGKTYQGRPLGMAFRLWKYEQEGQPEKAKALLAAENLIRKTFGRPQYDPSRDFTMYALEGGFTVRAGRAM